jgi:FKBP-type peptidyl-prolyl cis-trans isomerase (trigger factor)
MEVTDDELEAEITKYKDHYQQPEMKAMLDNPEYREMVRNIIGNSKVMQFLKTNVTLEEVKK